MFIHIFGFRWQPGTTDSDIARTTAAIQAFAGNIPGLLAVHAGPNLSPRSQGYAFAGLMTFTTREAYEAYTTHPQHLALLTWLIPLIEPVELDFEA